jgi:hypothetical protein
MWGGAAGKGADVGSEVDALFCEGVGCKNTDCDPGGGVVGARPDGGDVGYQLSSSSLAAHDSPEGCLGRGGSGAVDAVSVHEEEHTGVLHTAEELSTYNTETGVATRKGFLHFTLRVGVLSSVPIHMDLELDVDGLPALMGFLPREGAGFEVACVAPAALAGPGEAVVREAPAALAGPGLVTWLNCAHMAALAGPMVTGVAVVVPAAALAGPGAPGTAEGEAPSAALAGPEEPPLVTPA